MTTRLPGDQCTIVTLFCAFEIPFLECRILSRHDEEPVETQELKFRAKPAED